MGKTVAEIVTETIVEKMEGGEIPWHRPWVTHQAVNWKTQRPYRGINRWLLGGGEYLTYKQIKENGGKIKEDATSYLVVFYKTFDKKDDEDEESEENTKKRKGAMLRYYRVWEVSDVEGIESKRKDLDKPPVFTVDKCEELLMNYSRTQKVPYKHTDKNRAFYSPMEDYINVPPIEVFNNAEGYYATSFHESVHSTGHKSRLNRPIENEFGTKEYAREELVAEIGSAMLCEIMGISSRETLNNSVAYLQSWLEALEKDTNLVLYASAKAEKAVEMILGESVENVL